MYKTILNVVLCTSGYTFEVNIWMVFYDWHC